MPGWMIAQAFNCAVLIGFTALLVRHYRVRTTQAVGQGETHPWTCQFRRAVRRVGLLKSASGEPCQSDEIEDKSAKSGVGS